MDDLDLEAATDVATFFPSPKFWVKWRRNKTAMKAKGYSVVKIANIWYVLHKPYKTLQQQMEFEYALIGSVSKK